MATGWDLGFRICSLGSGMHLVEDAGRVFCLFPGPATGQDRDALRGCGPNFGFFSSAWLLGGIWSLGLGYVLWYLGGIY